MNITKPVAAETQPSENEQPFEQLRLKRHREFGPSSEQSPAQPPLFNEAEAVAAQEAAALAATAAGAADSSRTEEKPVPARGGRRALPAESGCGGQCPCYGGSKICKVWIIIQRIP